MFCTWLSSGLEVARLEAKIGRLLGMITARCGRKVSRSRGRATRSRSPESGAVRGVFEAMDRDAEGAISQHDMKVFFLPFITCKNIRQRVEWVCKTTNPNIE